MQTRMSQITKGRRGTVAHTRASGNPIGPTWGSRQDRNKEKHNADAHNESKTDSI